MFHHRRIHRTLSVMALIVMVLVLLGLPSKGSAALATTYYASSDPTGLTCSMFYPCSLQIAADKAVDGDTIIVEGGTYRSTGDQVLFIDDDVIIMGGWNGGFGRGYALDPLAYPTVLDGENARRVILIDGNSSPTLKGLEIYDGSIAAGEGGGVAILNLNSGDVILDQCWIYDNYAGWYGGGIAINKGSVTIRNGTLISNSAQYGGGAIMAGIGSTVTLENNTIGSNTASYGSAGHFDRASLTARSNVVPFNNGNPAFSINLDGGQSATFENNMIFGTKGVAVSVSPFSDDPYTVTFLHNTLANNENAGLSLPKNPTGNIANNIFLGHKAESIYLETGSSALVSNNLFWANSSDPNTGDHPILADPLLDSTFHLAYGSPAINAGAASTVTVDIDGQKRPLGLPDIGADEFSIPLYIPAVSR